MKNNRSSLRSQSGFSLIEVLVVISIVGVLAMVVVPRFGMMIKGYKMRNSVTIMTSDMRGLRQLAVSHASWTRMSFRTGLNNYSQSAWESRDRGATWQPLGARYSTVGREWDPNTYVDQALGLEDDYGSDGYMDVVFLPNGTVRTDAGEDGLIRFRNVQLFPRNRYVVAVRPSGAIQTTVTSD